jgi:hypothetical protein
MNDVLVTFAFSLDHPLCTYAFTQDTPRGIQVDPHIDVVGPDLGTKKAEYSTTMFC